MREEYDRQRKRMGDGNNATQYRLSQIVVSTETDAIDLIRRILKQINSKTKALKCCVFFC
uniref:Uncharacterized protein n=1 Tax=Polynucleobacter necessarius subsp. necessarius (strain STIR1) TaxID=452638 RepID=B1XUG3_POLNS